ncbi:MULTISPECIES: hypothetical protein [Dysgonomonas]|uniref:Uncharacterized protein n=1 Tax=Dysgonomonas gadei ATCC BAA-286 TaxID=742766 RepID=F5J3H1_9BACT|nr:MULTISPECIES: hypothetical protein [Dysgonomonas]EGJ99756.1 hypothetical protein HMPREF9455_03888 [Dysgonomonas gadei ATCC BAA-286]MBF0648157.1 hypothetical protein [Dysgonomonas sp. GY75]
MKKYISQIILISFVFLYENTSDYWVYELGEWTSIIRLTYITIFLCAIVYTFYNIVKCIEAKLKNKTHNIVTILMITALIIPFLMPGGLIPKRVLYKGDLLIAYLDGVAGNNGWLTLYGNNTYEYSYGREQLKGKYKIKNDTIYFDSPEGKDIYDFDYGTLWNDKSHISFGKDSIAYSYMKVIKNKLIK